MIFPQQFLDGDQGMWIQVTQVGPGGRFTNLYLPHQRRINAYEMLYEKIFLRSERVCKNVERFPYGSPPRVTHRIIFCAKSAITSDTVRLGVFSNFADCLLLKLLFDVHEMQRTRLLQLAKRYWGDITLPEQFPEYVSLEKKHKIIMRIIPILLVSPEATGADVDCALHVPAELYLEKIDPMQCHFLTRR